VAASGGHGSEFLFQGGVLLANTLIFAPAFALYGGWRYNRRWLLARDPLPEVGDRAKGGALPAARRAPRTLVPRTPTQALLWKDALVFTRDPAQLSQFFLFFLLLTVYVVSLLRIPHDLFGLGWRLLLYFGNLGAVSLILSSLTSRFLFPLPSLEGRSFWVVGLAPVERDFLLRQKVYAGAIPIVSIGAVAAAASGLFLGFDGWLLAGAIFDVVLIGWCLTALAAGFGAAYPNINEDNPARIAIGLGGTLNFFASAATIVAVLAIEGSPYLIFHLRPPTDAVAAAHAGALAFAVVTGSLALRLGRRALRRMEF
jgi:ABC-2 type transport system permease protein